MNKNFINCLIFSFAVMNLANNTFGSSSLEDRDELFKTAKQNVEKFYKSLRDDYKQLKSTGGTNSNNNNNTDVANRLFRVFWDSKMEGVSNNEIALSLTKYSASQGDAEGLYNLAYIMENPRVNVTQNRDYKAAYELYMESAHKGNLDAMERLVKLYLDPTTNYNGIVQADIQESLKWMEQAAAHHSPYYLKALGDMYSNGNPTYKLQKNVPKALKYYNDALKYEQDAVNKAHINNKIAELSK